MDGFNFTSASIWEIIQSQKKSQRDLLNCVWVLWSVLSKLWIWPNLECVWWIWRQHWCLGFPVHAENYWSPLDDCSLYQFESFVWVKNRGLEFGSNIFNMECSLAPVMRGECISLFRVGKWLQEMTSDINGTGKKFTFHENNCF